MDKYMKECFSTHSILHSLVGVGLGVVLANTVAALYGGNAMMIGVLLIVVGLGADYMMMTGKKK